jgi:hypothetical protein
MLRRRVDLAHQGRHGVGGETELSELTELGSLRGMAVPESPVSAVEFAMMCASQAVAWTTSPPEGPAT